MSKILNYISAGKGIGALLLLAFSFVVTVIFAVYIRVMGTDLIPIAQDIADQILPIRVENGRVVEPADTYKTARLHLEDGSSYKLPIVIDTRKDTLNTSNLRQGIYLSRTAIYSVNRNQTKIIRLEGSFDLPQADYSNVFRSALNWVSVFTAIFGAAFMFMFYFILTLFYAGCSVLLTSLAAKKMDFDQRMRLASVSLVGIYVILLPLRLLGLGTSAFVLFFAMIILEGVLIRKLPLAAQDNLPTPPAAA